MTGTTSGAAASGRPPRVLGIFAHPDDETLCAGGTFAKYADAGAEVRVVSLTKGEAGQIRDASAATRSTLASVREKELDAAGHELGLTEARCLDHPDGALSEIDGEVLVRLASELLLDLRPDVVVTFGPDGFSGHPDHVAVGAAVTEACYRLETDASVRLFHAHLPRSRMLLGDRLAEWVVELTTRFKGTQDFVRALSVFSREATALGYAADFVTVEWYPTGSYLIEQGEAATTMHFLLSGQVEIRREGDDGRVQVVDRAGPGEFVGEEGIATGRPRNAHVVAVDDVTSLTFQGSGPVPFDGRGKDVALRTRSLPSGDQIDARVTTCVDVSDFVHHKIRATAAHRSQYPIDPEMFPDRILREMFGAEYFIQVLPERALGSSLLEV
ncbi:MAG TPA: PIG-L family deacetylase [Nocardioides sp.]|nr:PIG-L family deacetylase [Nocardioides sp.]